MSVCFRVCHLCGGIYVGYRFYETAAEEGLINYEEQVLYPFGYGLSYTDFTQEMENFSDNGDTVSFDVKVTNTGDAAGKYAFIKHFVLNDQETNRCAMLLTYTDEQPMREIYLKPFEMSVKHFEGNSLAVMSSFNFIGDVCAGANPNLLNTVLRDEWGFRGMVLSDWNGSYGYQNTDDFVRNGNDAMPGFMQHESNEITNTGSATLVSAMRKACKNIFYTVVNSGNYTIPDPDAGKMDHMTKMFIGIDAGVAIAAIGAMVIVLIRWKKKRSAVNMEK